MLFDPAWRARVIAGFGGYAGLAQWQSRHDRAVLKQHDDRDETDAAPRAASSFQAAPGPTPETRPLSDPVFVLPPIPRGFYGRVVRETIWRPFEPKPAKCPFSVPIIVTLAELTAKRAAQQFGESQETQDVGPSGRAAKPPEPDPP